MSTEANESQSTVFGSRRVDLIAFIVLLFLMIVASRRLEVYSRMPAIEAKASDFERTSFDRDPASDFSFAGS